MKAKVSRFCHRLGIVFAGAWFALIGYIVAADGVDLSVAPLVAGIAVALYAIPRVMGWVVSAFFD